MYIGHRKMSTFEAVGSKILDGMASTLNLQTSLCSQDGNLWQGKIFGPIVIGMKTDLKGAAIMLVISDSSLDLMFLPSW